MAGEGVRFSEIVPDCCVLFVDDSPDEREIFALLLSEWGATVLVAGHALEALSIVESDRPDLLISDISLPDMSGYDLIRCVRSAEAPGARVPAIAVTGLARNFEHDFALDAGFDAYLVKPVMFEDLARAIGDLGREIRDARAARTRLAARSARSDCGR